MGSSVDTCPDTAMGRHGPLDGRGRCPWCRQKVDAAQPAPHRFAEESELTHAWSEYYDPDYGALSPAQIRQRYQMGQQS